MSRCDDDETGKRKTHALPPPPPHTHTKKKIAGGTLNRLVSRQAAKPHKTLYSHAQAACWAQQIAEALAYLHGSNPVVVHRDLKLANVLLRAPKDPRAKKRMETGEPSVRGPEGPSAGGGVVGGGGRNGESSVGAAAGAGAGAAAAAPTPGICCGKGEEETPTVALCDFGLSSSFIDPSVPFRRSELHAAEQAKAALQQQQGQQRGRQQGAGTGLLATTPSASVAGGGGIRGISPTGGVSLDTRRGSSVREQFARVSRGEEMNDHALAERSAAVGAALAAAPHLGGDGNGDAAAAAAVPSSARPYRPPPPAPSSGFRARRPRAHRPVLGAKGGISADLTGRTGSFM